MGRVRPEEEVGARRLAVEGGRNLGGVEAEEAVEEVGEPRRSSRGGRPLL